MGGEAEIIPSPPAMMAEKMSIRRMRKKIAVASSNNHPTNWSSSAKRKSPPRIRLAQYVELVFHHIALALRVLGILASNTAPKCEFWRLDRGGGVVWPRRVGCEEKGMGLFVGSLVVVWRIPPGVMGYHTESISWDPSQPQNFRLVLCTSLLAN